MKEVKEVKEVDGKQGGVGVVLVEERGRERRFELGGNDGKKAVDCLKFALFCMKRKRILERVGEQKLNRKLIALEMVDGGRVWSFDGSLMVCFLSFGLLKCPLTEKCTPKKKKKKIQKWSASPHLGGVKKGTYKLSPLRSLNLNNQSVPFNPAQRLFSCFIPVGDKEIYTCFSKILRWF